VLTLDEAREIAEAFLRDEIQPRVDQELAIAEMEEFPTCWVAVFNSRNFIETGHISCALAGNSPLIINKRTKVLRLGATGVPVEDQLDP
jgi:hypothetical protein